MGAWIWTTTYSLNNFPIIAVVHRRRQTWQRDELYPLMGVGTGISIDRDPRYPHVIALQHWQVGRRQLCAKLNMVIPDRNIVYFRHGRMMQQKRWGQGRLAMSNLDEALDIPPILPQQQFIQYVDFDWLAQELLNRGLIGRCLPARS